MDDAVTGLRAGKRVLVTGATTHQSIAFAAAREAQLAGAEIVLTTFGSRRPMAERAARRFADPPDVLELDVHRQDDLAEVRSERAGRASIVRMGHHATGMSGGPPSAVDQDSQ